MRTGLVFLTCLSLVGTAHAAPVTMNISAETAIVDLEKRTFKPPLYPEFPLIRVGESDLSFGSELPTLSTWGGLDRVSGSLSMNVMRPNVRKNLQAGGTAHFLAFLSAKCAPAQRMFKRRESPDDESSPQLMPNGSPCKMFIDGDTR